MISYLEPTAEAASTGGAMNTDVIEGIGGSADLSWVVGECW
jgi:hypothetical protein